MAEQELSPPTVPYSTLHEVVRLPYGFAESERALWLALSREGGKTLYSAEKLSTRLTRRWTGDFLSVAFACVVGVTLAIGSTHTISAQGVAAPRANAGAGAPIPQMRTRLLTSLTGYEVADYLKRNDVIFVPVGPTEVNGGNPTDVEYVIPLAYSLKLAEKSDGLVLPYLAYFYPGSTTINPGTVMVSPEEGITYLKVLTRSLVRQGFRRIIFVTSHGPSGDTLAPLVREIFDQDHVPVVWMSTSVIDQVSRDRTSGRAAQGATTAGASAAMAEMMSQRKLVTYGSYRIVGRLSDLPTGFSVAQHPFEADAALVELSRHLLPGQSEVGRFYADASEHGGWPTPVTPEERDEWGKKGADLIESHVNSYDVAGMLDALRQHDLFTRKQEQKYGTLLPSGSSRP